MAGATGVIGRRVVPLLVSAGHRVTALGRTPEHRTQLERIGATGVHADLFALDTLRKAVTWHDAVVNLATHIPSNFTHALSGRLGAERSRAPLRLV
jgi:nucleoside-diphosphate-sugar epimerase